MIMIMIIITDDTPIKQLVKMIIKKNKKLIKNKNFCYNTSINISYLCKQTSNDE